MSDSDDGFVAFGDGRRWIVAIDDAHPDFWWAVTEVVPDGATVVEHVEEFWAAAASAAKRAQPFVDRAPATGVPDTATGVRWMCRWALEAGGVGGLVKTGRRRYLHAEVEQEGGEVTVLDEWDDFVDAVSVILSPHWDE